MLKADTSNPNTKTRHWIWMVSLQKWRGFHSYIKRCTFL